MQYWVGTDRSKAKRSGGDEQKMEVKIEIDIQRKMEIGSPGNGWKKKSETRDSGFDLSHSRGSLEDTYDNTDKTLVPPLHMLCGEGGM